MSEPITTEVLRDCYFETPPAGIEDYSVLFGVGDLRDYEESLYCILSKDGQLFEYEDSHCSCNGFTFNPQPATVEYLLNRIHASYWLTEEQKSQALAVVNAIGSGVNS